MVTDRFGNQYDSILAALKAVRGFDAKFNEAYPAGRTSTDLADMRADLDAIIASASGAVAAAGLPRDEVLARAAGMARAA